MRQNRRERGQVVIMLLLAMSIFIFGAIGLAIDGAHLYAQRQLAQTAADAAAQAAMMSIFAKTNIVGEATYFPTSYFTCSGYPASTPCRYALHNGFDGTGTDIVALDFNSNCPAPGLESMLAVDPVNITCATVSRLVDTTLMRLLGPTATTVTARGIAATVDVVSPVPILVTHPTKPDAFFMKGTGSADKVRILGGPELSIQVNSTGGAGSSWGGTGQYAIDLSAAGPSGTGGDFGSFGLPSDMSTHLNLGTEPGEYIQPSAPISDPLASVCPAGGPGCLDPGPPATPPTTVNSGVGACPAAADHCTLYYPGKYAGITFDQKTGTALFMPGLYYITKDNDFRFRQHGNGQMAVPPVGCSNSDPQTGCGMVVYLEPGSGTITVDANAGTETGIALQGDTISPTDPASVYKGILFFDRNSPGIKTHDLSGGGAMSLVGTIYMQTTSATLANYQEFSLGGNSGNTTTITGMIIADTLTMHGTPIIRMYLNPLYRLNIRKVALVK